MGFFNFNLQELLYVVPAVLLCMMVHECCHGWVAYLLGDPTAKNSGRLTLNPLAHIDPIGLICMIVARFGWAKPVPVNMRYFKKPRQGMALVALAGPVSNLVLGFVGIVLFYVLQLYLGRYAFFSAMAQFFGILASISIGFAVFNLIPLPPLDGSRILGLVLPRHWYYWLLHNEHYIQIGFFVLLMAEPYLRRFGINLISLPLATARNWIMNWMEVLVQWIILR